MIRKIKLPTDHPYWPPVENFINKISAFSQDSEALRVFLLIALTIYAYHPFFSASNIGGADAQFYQYMLHDAIIQLENGFFPPYVGQSLFLPSGTPATIRAPFFSLLGQLLNTLSFGALNALFIQHLTIFVSALSAVFILYIVIRNVAPSLRWQAVFLAFAYISSPGVMSSICYMDMYFAFMAVPFVPVVFYGLSRIYQNNDALAYVLTGSALALVWMSHPPIAMWISMLSLVYCLALIVLTRRNPARFAGMALLFALLCLWQILPIFSLGLDQQFVPPQWDPWRGIGTRVDQIMAQLLLPLPDAFLPLDQGKNGLYFLQLGYSLWFVIILAVITALRSSGTLLIRLMLALIACILLFLYPLPGIGRFLWSSVPSHVIDMTNITPQQRLYIILAAAGSLVGALALQRIATSRHLKVKVLVAIAFTGLFVWNLHEIGFNIKHTNAIRASNESIMNPIDSWNSPNNINYFGWILPNEYLKDFFTGNHSPWFQSRLLDSQQNPISAYDNEQFVFKQCLERTHVKNEASDNISLPFETTLKEPLSITQLNLQPNIHYLLCADMSASHGDAIFQLLDQQRREQVSLEIPGTTVGPLVRRTIGVPFYFTDQDKENKEQMGTSFDFRVWSREQPLVKLYNVQVTSYEPANLPIVIESYTPFKATVVTKPDHKYIEIKKLFIPGYVARVNGEKSPILASERKTMIIQLKNSGLNKIELSYTGTPSMKATFYISAATWFLVIVFLMARLFSHMKWLWKIRQLNKG